MIAKIRSSSRSIVRELGLLDISCCGEAASNSEIHALIELEGQGALSIQELSNQLNLRHSTASRLVARLVERGYAFSKSNVTDRRGKVVSIASPGKTLLARVHASADSRVNAALSVLTPAQRELVSDGLSLYAVGLERSRRRQAYSIRPIKRKDNSTVASIIRSVMTEFGATAKGFAIHDREVDAIFETYQGGRALYLVVTKDDVPLGGGGIQQLKGGSKDTCELQKMYFLAEVRGLGIGEEVLLKLLETAKQRGFTQCYLETTGRMYQAKNLYEKLGFIKLKGPLGNTGHSACEGWYLKTL